jgi:(p)ppGpp synthase/HD superfamily hydrolase
MESFKRYWDGYINSYLTEDQLLELAMDAAISFAQDMHKGQVRKGDGKPYAVHPQAVYSILKSFRVKDRELLVAAWLHDTIEDTAATFNAIKNKFNKNVANLVKAVSSSKKEIKSIGKEVYLLKKMLAMSNNELTLKLADRLHNVTDILTMPAKTSENTFNQTTFILAGLKKRGLTKIQKKIIRAIEKYLDKYAD